jgi:hypothetical protein
VLATEGGQAGQRRPGHHDQVDALAGVLGGTVELVEQGAARRARCLDERQQRRPAGRRAGPVVVGVAGEHGAPSGPSRWNTSSSGTTPPGGSF